MSIAESTLSVASFVLSGHAKLDAIASDEELVKKTRRDGHRIVSSSVLGGYGNHGAWGIVRRIEEQDLQQVLDKTGVIDTRARQILADERPLWHLVVENMLESGKILTSRLILPSKQDLMDGLYTYIAECCGELTARDFHVAIQELEPMMKVFYDSAKADSKWKGQVAYAQVSPNRGLRKTLINTLCDDPGDLSVLVAACLDYTAEALCDPNDPRRLSLHHTDAGSMLTLDVRPRLPFVALGTEELLSGHWLEVDIDTFGDGDIVVGAVSVEDFCGAMPGARPGSVGLSLDSNAVLKFETEPIPQRTAIGRVHHARVTRSEAGCIVFELHGLPAIEVPFGGARWWPAIGVQSKGARLRCSRRMRGVALDRPWLVLADVRFGVRDSAKETAKADLYENNPFHCCAYAGNVECLRALLTHVKKYEAHGDLQAAVSQKTLGKKLAGGKTPLQTAQAQGQAMCETIIQGFLFGTLEALPVSMQRRHKSACSVRLSDEKDERVFLETELVVGWNDMLADALRKVRNTQLRIRGASGADCDGARIRDFLELSSNHCARIVWTRSSLAPTDFVSVISWLSRRFEDQDWMQKCSWQEIGLGFSPPTQPDTDLQTCQELAPALDKLVRSAARMPLGCCLKLTVGSTWNALLSPEDLGIVHALASVEPVHDWWKQKSQTQRDGEPNAKSQNPLAANPFMTGLCRLKHVAVGGNFQRLDGSASFQDAISPAAQSFLRLLIACWTTFLESAMKHAMRHACGEFAAYLRQTVEFLADMPDFAPMVQPELAALRSLLDVSDRLEQRIATDGVAYTAEEFRVFFGEGWHARWERAPPRFEP